MKLDLKNPDVIDLIKDAHNGELVLPQFQRSFVWAYVDVIDFLQSMFRRYFIGTFLFQDCDKENIPFDYRALEGVDLSKENLNPEKLILDGQQRITTLHYVLYSPEGITLKNTKYPYKFFLNLKEMNTEDIEDEAIFGEREDHSDKYLEKEFQFKNRIIPFTVLKSHKTWSDWQSEFETWLIKRDEEAFIKYSQEEKNHWREYIDTFFLNFSVPVVELNKITQDDEKGLAEVCAIFEKMNTTGVKLSVFDLLTARLYKDKIDLRQLWDDSLLECKNIAEFSDGDTDKYGVFILRTIGLIRGIETKNKKLINLKPNNFEDDWNHASKFVEKAIKRITSIGKNGFGVFEKYWLPYPPMIPTVAATLYRIEQEKLGANAYSILRRWYWGSIFTERYQSAVESKTTADYKSIMQAILQGDMSGDVFIEIEDQITNNKNYTLKRVSRVNAVYKGVMNILALNGAKDFKLDDSINFHDLDDHHIFPVKYLKDKYKTEIKDEQINVVLNKTLIHQSTNKSIGKRKPSDYLRDSKIIPQRNKVEILSSHLMDDNTIKFLEKNRFEEFIDSRDRYIVDKIKSLV